MWRKSIRVHCEAVEDAAKAGVEFIPFLRVEPDVLADFGGGDQGEGGCGEGEGVEVEGYGAVFGAVVG